MCDQVDQVVPAHQVDDINEVPELDPVHQVDHKDEFSNMISSQRTHHKVHQPGFQIRFFFQLFFEMSQGHFEGGMILIRLSFWRGSWSILRSFLVDFFSTSGNGPKLSKMDLGVDLGQFLGRPEADF